METTWVVQAQEASDRGVWTGHGRCDSGRPPPRPLQKAAGAQEQLQVEGDSGAES